MACTIVIPCHNGIEDTRACLQSLAVQVDAPPLEVILVDNGSTDGSPALTEYFGFASVLRLGANRGFAAGANAGLREARSDWVVVCNNDTMAAPTLVARLLRAAREPHVGLAAPVSNHVKGPARIEVGATGATESGRLQVTAELDATCGGLIQDVDNLSGLCLLGRRSLWQQLGGFDERFGTGNYEDDDLCLRARLSGHRLVIARDAFLHHRGHRTFERLGVDYRQELRQRRAQFCAKWGPDPAGRALLMAGRGELRQAARLGRLAQRRYPSWPDSHLLQARWHAEAGQSEAARRHSEAFLLRCPRHTETAVRLGVQLLACGDDERGHEQLTRALGQCYFTTSERVDLLHRLAHRGLQDGHPERAAHMLREALHWNADVPELHNLLGAALLETGRMAEAQSYFEIAATRGEVQAHTNLGICLWRQGRPQEAVDAMTEAVRLDPTDEVAHANLQRALHAVLGCDREGLAGSLTLPADPSIPATQA